MKIALIAAMAKNRAIGKDNTLPWPRHSADMQHFRELTLGKVVIMGRHTFESIGKPLKGRINIVISKDISYGSDRPDQGFIVATSVGQALNIASIFSGNSEIMVIGGASVYEQFLPLANKIYLTIVDAHPEGDTFFPRYSPEEWRVNTIRVKFPDKKNLYSLSFAEVVRISP